MQPFGEKINKYPEVKRLLCHCKSLYLKTKQNHSLLRVEHKSLINLFSRIVNFRRQTLPYGKCCSSDVDFVCK